MSDTIVHGRTEPRLWTRPLRPLTRDTTLGYDVSDFAREVLGVNLYPWQEWLLVHALELLPDGRTLRYRRVITLVARQQGKSMLAYVLAAYWLFVDAERLPDDVDPRDYLVVGTAQNLDIAAQPWRRLARECDPRAPKDEANPTLQQATERVRTVNGDMCIIASDGARYEIRSATNSRGKPACKVILDEIREQHTWDAWNALSPTTKSFRNGQLWAISNAGDARSVVLKSLRDSALKLVDDWSESVERDGMTADAWASSHDTTLGIFEWSAPDGCDKRDTEGILQSNPSIGYGAMTVQTVLSDIDTMTDAAYRTEDLCQWVTAKVDSYVSVDDWKACERSSLYTPIDPDARLVWAVDTASNRDYTYVAAATYTTDGEPAVQLVKKGKGMLWLADWLGGVALETGRNDVYVQAKGCPAAEFIGGLERAGLNVVPIQGTDLSNVAGHFRDAVRGHRLVHPRQPAVDMSVEGCLTRRMAECDAWDRRASLTDIAGLVAESEALYGLEQMGEPDDSGVKFVPSPTMPVVI